MNYFLYTWNPDRWGWDDYEDRYVEFLENGCFEDGWSLGSTRKPRKNDRFFLMKLGTKTKEKGIIGSGSVLSEEPYPGDHWDPEVDKETFYTDCIFDHFAPENKTILSLQDLKIIDPNFIWTPQGSGKQIPKDLALKLEKAIDELTPNNKIKKISYLDKFEDIDLEVYPEGKKVSVYTTQYERDPRNRKLAIQHHGTSCMACGFSFKESYGDWSNDYIEVHHLKPLSQVGESFIPDPKKDMIVLCSNCHKMVHRKKNNVLSLKELIQLIQKDV